MAVNYHLPNIRTLLTEGFSEAELRDFCFDTPQFRPVHHELADLSGKTTIVRHLLDYAARRDLLDLLLAWTKAQNLAQYANHQPYKLPSQTPSPRLASPSPRPLRVFLCHAAADKPAVRDLYQRLQNEGFIQPWLDEEELLPGQDWQLEIPKAVRASDVVLVCFSPQSVTRAGYVQKEIRFALDIADEQPEGTIFLIPVRLEPCEAPERLRRWHWANLYDARGYGRLLRALRLRAEAIGISVTMRPQAQESSSTLKMPNTAPPAAAPQPAENLPAQRGTFHFVEPGTESQSPILKGHDVAYSPSPKIITLTHPIHLELVRVSAGEFLMGSNPAIDKNAQKDEQPQHRVYVSEFFIGRYPITNEQYAIFVRATKQRPPPHLEKGRISPGKENHPVVYISVDEALTFCDWLSQESGRTFRLPTEAEWEKAARGTDGRIYPWGNKWDKAKLNSGDGGPGTTTSVSHYSPDGDSPYGAADMCGNVWEWCADWYSDMEYQRRAKTVTKDPLGSEKESIRVLRGGAFLYKASWARCAARYANEGYVGYRSNGLRVVGTAASFLEH